MCLFSQEIQACANTQNSLPKIFAHVLGQEVFRALVSLAS